MRDKSLTETCREIPRFTDEAFLDTAFKAAKKDGSIVAFELKYMSGLSRGLSKSRAILEALKFVELA